MATFVIIVLLGIIATAVAPDLTGLVAGLGCLLTIIAGALTLLLIVLVMTGVIQ